MRPGGRPLTAAGFPPFVPGGPLSAIADRLRRNGIRVYLWPGMTHAKALLVDGWACLGSANLNQWSLRLSEEENIATSDPAFAAQLKSQVFEPDFARSYELKEPIRLNVGDHVVKVVGFFSSAQAPNDSASSKKIATNFIVSSNLIQIGS